VAEFFLGLGGGIWGLAVPPAIMPETAWDMGKTMSYAGKIISDIIQTTSDIISAFANT